MNTYLISYCNKIFFRSQRLLNQSAFNNGIKNIISYNEKWLKKTEFYKENKNILKIKRGAGYWLWKPFIILETLKKVNEGDIIIHIDAGTKIINSIESLCQMLQYQDIVLFNNNGHKNGHWTKRDCFYYMDCDTERFHNGLQVVAGYLVCRNTEYVRNFMEEWLHYASDERIISDNPNTCGLNNLPEFKEHRHDQSVLSLLAAKHNLTLFRDPSQWGNKYKQRPFRQSGEFVEGGSYIDNLFTSSTYPTILNGHRLKLKLTLADHIKWLMLK